MRISILLLIGFLSYSLAYSNTEETFQTIRGRIIDKVSQSPIPNASVILLMENKITKNATANAEGEFRLSKIATGRHFLKIMAMGFKPQTIPMVLISGKEAIIDIELEESYTTLKEVIIQAGVDKTKALNEMSYISSRGFTTEEANRYAGARMDPSRMAQNFAGVGLNNDSRNDIIVRGNAPSGFLWRLEGIDIPNPNHFSINGATGGGVGMLNNNALANSDFLTGAFIAEYANALSGAFDLKMRNGNNEKKEYTAQVGINGFELGAEGPISSNSKASYLAYYRLSRLDLMKKMGVTFGMVALPHYQDLCLKLNFPLKKGNLSFFGLGGKSNIFYETTSSDEKDLVKFDNKNVDYLGYMGTAGGTLSKPINGSTFLKTSLGFSYENPRAHIDSLNSNYNIFPYLKDNTNKYKWSLNSHLSKKWGGNIHTKVGFWQDMLIFNYSNRRYIGGEANNYKDLLNISGNTLLSRVYNEWTINASEKFGIHTGLSAMYLFLNNSKAIEPRLGFSYEVNNKQNLNIGYGVHNKTQDMMNYYIQTKLSDGSYASTNKDLGFTRSQHWVLGYNWIPNENIRIKVETYYQYLDRVPVERKSSSFSMLNWGASYMPVLMDSLQNKGTGKNLGVEFTLERFFNDGYYYLLSTSLFDSKYKGSDGIERNTAFNNTYVANGLLGKEVVIQKNHILSADIKFTWAGGKRYSPVDINASRIAGEVKYDDSQAYSKQFDPYFRIDIKIGYKLNSLNFSQEFTISIENLTNKKNLFTQDYNSKTQEVYNVYQLGFFPVGLYRINF